MAPWWTHLLAHGISIALVVVPSASLQVGQPHLADIPSVDRRSLYLMDSSLDIPEFEFPQDDLRKGALEVQEMPKALHGRNIVLAGDSNDRQALIFMCAAHNATIQLISTLRPGDGGDMNDDAVLKDTKVCMHFCSRFCNIEKYDVSIMYHWHGGVMSSLPEPSWHQEAINKTGSGYLIQNQTLQLARSPTNLVKRYWQRVAKDYLPDRPMIFLTQSSFWDSQMAYMQQHSANSERDPKVAPRRPLGGPRKMRNTDVHYEDWGWLDHATSYMEAVLDSGLPLERVLWRTCSNCPTGRGWGSFLNAISEEQAIDVRNATTSKLGPWAHVDLLDYRLKFDPAGQGICKGVHTQASGYAHVWNELYDTILHPVAVPPLKTGGRGSK